MSSEDMNVSAFAAYKQSGKSKPEYDHSIRIDDFLTAELRQFVEKSKKKSRKELNKPHSSSRRKILKTNGHNSSRSNEKKNSNNIKESKSKTKKSKAHSVQNPTGPDNLNFTEDFESTPKKLQATSTPSIQNGLQHKKASKSKQPITNELPMNQGERSPQAKKASSQKATKLHGSTSTIQQTPTRSGNAHAITEKLNPDGSIALGHHLLQWLINPVKIDDFKQQYWEKAPICINRFWPKYYSHLLSTNTIDEMLRDNIIEYTKNIDITSYENGVRETHNPEGRALPPNVWNFYRDGCSIRLLNPQTFVPQIHELNATLQEYFHCMTGANVYLTPPNSQGFAPHYDDIEAFVLQIEGKKLWRLYAPRTENEYLPRVSSGNFHPDEIGEPILERTLNPGDLMYFPRGTIHQATTVPGFHSLHITLSVYQKTAYGDLMEILLPRALERAIISNLDLRRGLPLNIWNNFGLVNQDEDTTQRKQTISRIKSLFMKVIDHFDIDEAVDQMAIKYQHDALPPVITPIEAPLTVYGNKGRMTEDGQMEYFEFEPDTQIRLLRANILRMIEHEDVYRVYFYTDNSKEYHEFEPNYLEIDSDMAPAVEHLIKAYPQYITVDDLPLNNQLNMDITVELWNRGLIMLHKPAE